MRAGWLVLLTFMVVGVGSVAGMGMAAKRGRLFDAFEVGMLVGWMGIGVTAAVMLGRGVSGDGLWGWVERSVLRTFAVFGLFPLLFLGLVAVFGWRN